MRKQNTKTKVPLDVVPERCTKPFPPRFRPVGRFCELRFRQLSSPTGREGGRDKSASRPYETDTIHPLGSTCKQYQFLYIQNSALDIFSIWYAQVCTNLIQSIFNNCARTLARTLTSRLRPLVELLLFFIRYDVVTTGAKQMRLHMCIAENIKQSILCHSISFMSFCTCFCVLISGFEADIDIFLFL